MRVLAAVFMVLLLVSPSLLRLGMLGYYQANKAEITRLHCVNRDKPQLHCEGKCYLLAQLEKARHEQDQMEGIFAGWDKADDWLPFFQPAFGLCPASEPDGEIVVSYLLPWNAGWIFGVFRPPQGMKTGAGLSPHKPVEHDQFT